MRSALVSLTEVSLDTTTSQAVEDGHRNRHGQAGGRIQRQRHVRLRHRRTDDGQRAARLTKGCLKPWAGAYWSGRTTPVKMVRKGLGGRTGAIIGRAGGVQLR